MTRHVNAYTLSERTPRSGIAVVFPKPGHPEIRLGNAAVEGEYRRVLLGLGGADMPCCVLDQMESAQTRKLPGDHRTHLVHHDGRRCIVLRIIARELDFGLPPLARGLFFWPGGEGMRGHLPIARFGRPGETTVRDEIFIINEGQHIFVGDTRSSIIVLSCVNSVPVTRPATRAEVIEFVFDYGMHVHSANTGALIWTLNNLFALGALTKAGEVGGACTASAHSSSA